MSDRLIEQLSKMKTQNGRMNPDRAWVLRNRDIMLQKLNATTDATTTSAPAWDRVSRVLSQAAHIFVPKNILATARVALTVVLVAGVAVSGWIASVSASQDSLPGEALYGVKLATEKTELIVATVINSEEGKATTNLKHAARKVEEYKKAKNPQQAAASIKSLKEKITSTQESLEKVKEKSSKQAVTVAKVVDEKTEEILDALDKKDEAGVVESTDDPTTVEPVDGDDPTAKELSKEVDEVEDLIEQTGVKAVEVLVEKVAESPEGEEKIAEENEVKEKIARKLDRIATELVELDTEIDQASQLVAASTTLRNAIVEEVVESATEATEESSAQPETTDETGTSEESISEEEGTSEEGSVVETQVKEKVEEAGQKVDEATKKGEETVEEAKTLIEQNDLLGAIKKVQELGEVTKQAKEVVDEVKDVVDEAVKDVGVETIEKEITEQATDEVSEEKQSATDTEEENVAAEEAPQSLTHS